MKAFSRFAKTWNPGRGNFTLSRPTSNRGDNGLAEVAAQLLAQAPQAEEENGLAKGIGAGLGKMGMGIAKNLMSDSGDSSGDIPDSIPMGERSSLLGNDIHGGASAREKYGTPGLMPDNKYVAPSAAHPAGSSFDALLARGRGEINARENKDWTGKDRDKDHNFWDVLKTAGIGALKGGASADPRGGLGAILGGMLGGAGAGAGMGIADRNADEKIINEAKLQKAYGNLARTQEAQSNDLANAYKNKQIQDIDRREIDRIEDNRRLGDKAQADAARDRAKLDLQNRTFDWKREDRDKYFELEYLKEEARKNKDEKGYALNVRRQEEIERRNRKTEGQTDRRLGQADTRLGQTAGNAEARDGTQAASVINSIRTQGEQNGKTPEEIEQRIQQYLNTLPARVKKALGN